MTALIQSYALIKILRASKVAQKDERVIETQESREKVG